MCTVALAARSPGFLIVAPHIILSPTYQQIGRFLRQGTIGTVVAAHGLGGPDWSRWYSQAGGDGPLFDLAGYNVAGPTGWRGPVRHVGAVTGITMPERLIGSRRVQVSAEDNTVLRLDFGDATFASVTGSVAIQQHRDATIELYGTHGTIRLQGDDWAPRGIDRWLTATGIREHLDELAPE